MNSNSSLLRQLEQLEADFANLRRTAASNDSSGGAVPADVTSRFITGARAAIIRIAGDHSAYMAEFEAVRSTKQLIRFQAVSIAGIIGQLKRDFCDGFLATTRELVHAETFADFLEMSDHLVREGYKDAAALIAGSSLEVHLRHLAAKHNISTNLNGRAKKADLINSELTAASAYSKLDQKNVTAWLDLRNNAAHGHYGAYSQTQVELFLSQIRDFMARIPA